MSITLEQSSFSRTLQSVLGTVATKTTLPLLTHFLLEAEDGVIKTTGTDLDVAMVSSLQTESNGRFRITIPARRLVDVIRELPRDEIEIDVKDQRVTIRSRKTIIQIPGANADDYPSLPDLRLERRITTPARTLERLIRRTLYAVSDDTTNPTLTGALLSTSEGELRMVATDGHRLARASTKGPITPLGKNDPIIPPKGLEQVLRLVGDDPGDVEIGIDKNHAAFHIGATTIFCRLIEGPFPNYEQVIPHETKYSVTVDRAEMISGLRRIYSLSDSLTHQVKITFSPGQIALESRTQDLGEGTTEIPAEYAGDPFTAGYNAQYLLDILKSFESDRFEIKLNTPITAAVLQPLDMPEGEDLLCLLMPLRLTA